MTRYPVRGHRFRIAATTMLATGMAALALVLGMAAAEEHRLAAAFVLSLAAALVMACYAWGYWILRVETGPERMRLVVPTVRFGLFWPPRRVHDVSWGEVRTIVLRSRTVPVPITDTDTVAGMPYGDLWIEAAGRTIHLTSPMMPRQIGAFAALVSERSDVPATGPGQFHDPTEETPR